MIVFSAFGCFSCFAAESTGEETDSGTYDFTIEDASRIQRYCAYYEMLNEARETLYDVNFDGFVTVGDASLIQMHIAGIINIHGGIIDATGKVKVQKFREIEVEETVIEKVEKKVIRTITE